MCFKVLIFISALASSDPKNSVVLNKHMCVWEGGGGGFFFFLLFTECPRSHRYVDNFELNFAIPKTTYFKK